MSIRPNIVFIMSDQLRADFLSCYDAAFIDTSHIDKRLYTNPSYSGSPDFGRVGWLRKHP